MSTAAAFNLGMLVGGLLVVFGYLVSEWLGRNPEDGPQ